MKHILSINEWSKNDPIPEIFKNNGKLGIILMGAPAVGKSFFIQNYIAHKNRNIKVFSTDDVSLLYTKDHNKFREGSGELNIKRLRTYVKSGGSYVFDTNGSHTQNIEEIVKLSRENGYDVIFIHLMGTLDMSLKQNQSRNRNVDTDYLLYSYKTQSKNMKFYSDLNPDKYYIVYNIDGKYKFMRYEDGKLLKRKVDKYVPLNESVENSLSLSIKNHLIDLIDIDLDIKIKGIGDDDYSNILDASYVEYTKDMPFIKKTQFEIYIPGNHSFAIFNEIINVMFTFDTYITKDGWKLSEFKNSEFGDLRFKYEKDDVVVDNDITSKDLIKFLKKYFSKISLLELNDVDINDNNIEISFTSLEDDFGNSLSMYQFEDIVDDLVNILGGGDFEFDINQGKIIIDR